MKDMIYREIRTFEMLGIGQYKGLNYYIVSLGTHPCAYVDVSETKLNNVDYNDIDIRCHGGLTYSRNYLYTVRNDGWFIGWDYAHYEDFVCDMKDFNCAFSSNDKKWTTCEIVNECKSVIDQIVAMEGDKNEL